MDPGGNLYVTGSSVGSGTGTDFATVFYDNYLNWVAEYRYNGPGNSDDSATAIAVDGFGNVYVAGESQGIWTGKDYATIKYDTDGNFLWEMRYGGDGNDTDEAKAMFLGPDGSVHVTGKSVGSGPPNIEIPTITITITIMESVAMDSPWTLKAMPLS